MRYFNVEAVVLFCFASLSLTACGGGGGGGGGSSTSSLSVTSPTAVSSASLTQGSTYAGSTGNYGQATSIVLDDYDVGSGYYNMQALNSSVATQLHPKDHLTDTGATSAWSSGWTGYGKNIAILDDFTDAEAVYIPLTLTRTATETGYDSGNNAVTMTGTYSVEYAIKFNTTHGDLVSNIAGGDAAATSTSVTYNFDALSVTETNCDTNGAVSFNTCDADASWSMGYWDDSSANVDFNKVAGVAKDATMVHSNIDLGSGATTTLSTVGAKFNNLTSGNHVINLSMESSWASWVKWSDIEGAWSSNNYADYFNATDAVVVVSAGNQSASCGSSDMGSCNAIATILTLDGDTADETIVAGALNSAGSGIASYSNEAGTLKQRYLMASGETGYKKQSNGSSVVGTSFAAPRIAGAAALVRHKFPNLTGAQTASILLLTADKDIDGNGTDEFSEVSNVFGHGKLDLSTALSPVGSLAVQ